ncbi:MAG: hypothetical protein IJ215_02630 [Clostridia bacterium]|nr:hypothetical protein [Clostridia bacterium]
MILQNYKEIYKQSKKSSIVVYLLLRVLIILCLVREFMLGNYMNAMLCIYSLILLAVPLFVKRRLKISLPSGLEISIFCFIFAAEILGEIDNFYGNIPIWDTMLHTINGFLAASVGFSLIDLLNNNVKNFSLSPVFVAIVAFCFSMTIGVLWEFFEFTADNVARTDMQKDRIVNIISTVELDPEKNNNAIVIKDIAYTVLYDEEGNILTTIDGGYLDIGIIDTMKDLFVNLLGAVVFSVFGYLYIVDRDKYKIAKRFQIKKIDEGKKEEV